MKAVPSPVPGPLQQSDSHGKLREWGQNCGLAARQKGPARVCKFQLGFVFVKLTRLGTICPQFARELAVFSPPPKEKLQCWASESTDFPPRLPLFSSCP